MKGLINPDDSLTRQRDKLLNICSALMRRVEQAPEDVSQAYTHFERAALLDAQVKQRTAALEHALALLNESNSQLAKANSEIDKARTILNEAIEGVDEGFALFDAQETLVLHNSRFCRDLSDVLKQLKPGMAFEAYVECVSRSPCLDLPGPEERAAWAKRRLFHHVKDRVVFNVALTRDRWLQVSEHRTQDGGTVILQTDITDVMRAERKERAQLVDSQARMLRATLDHLAQGVCIFDSEACLVGWNRKLEEMMQLPATGVRIGMRFSRILDILDQEMALATGTKRTWLLDWSAKAQGRDPITFELDGQRGQIFSVLAQEMPDRGFVISFTDVTAERRSAEALRDLNRTLELRVAARTEELGAALKDAERANVSKNRFVAAASHDLLQPLSAAKLYLASLQDRDIDGEVSGIAQKAENALISVEEIIDALLDISRLDAGQAAFDVQPVALSTVLSSLSSEMTPQAEAKGLDLTVVPSTLTVVSDPVFLRRILQNLLSNAIRYTEEGRILIGARRRPNLWAEIMVLDTGRGIAREDQGRVFQEFARLEASHSGANGLGLGLAIVERACTSLGHSLRLVSELGRGSCFAVGLGVHKGASAVAKVDREEPGGPDHLRGRMLLLVEDDDALAHAMTLKMESWGAHVIHANSGEEALALLGEIDLAPDMMLLDYQLGQGMDGLELCGRLRDLYGEVPSFIISANRSAALSEGCARLDVPLLKKPMEATDLRRVLNAALS